MKVSLFETRLGSAEAVTSNSLRTAAIAGARPLLLLASVLSVFSTSYVQAQNVTPIQAVTPDPNGAITPERMRAQRMFQGLTAVRVPIDDARLVSMEALIKAGNLTGAAAIATADPLFLDIQVRDIAREMSSRAETVREPMNDFVASFIGVVRDSDTVSAKELLTMNAYYRVDPAIIATLPTNATVRQAELADIIQSNNHYADMQARNLSPKAVLIRQTPQRMIRGGAAIDVTDAAGLLTTRAFIAAHADAGTMRRPNEYAFREFMCLSMPEWADANVSDERVGRDVTRTPSGSKNLYDTTCKACHGQMDGLRGAWALLDFNNNAATSLTAVNNRMNRNATEEPKGWVTADNSFVNFATLGKNATQLGWRSALTGTGMAQYGQMLANSRAFSRCMVKRAFTRVCRRTPQAGDEGVLQNLATQFEAGGYHMRHMFESVAANSQCIQ